VSKGRPISALILSHEYRSYAREDPWLPGGGDHDLLAGIIRCSDRAVGTQTVIHTSLNVQNPLWIQVWDYQPGSAMPADILCITVRRSASEAGKWVQVEITSKIRMPKVCFGEVRYCQGQFAILISKK